MKTAVKDRPKTIRTERKNGTIRVQTVPEGKSKTEQSHKSKCNINSIVAKIKRGAYVPPNKVGTYGDFTNYQDFHTTKNRILEAEKKFMELPSKIRSRFDNDPGRLLEFLSKPENVPEAIEIGLLTRKAEDTQINTKSQQSESQTPPKDTKEVVTDKKNS